MISETIKSIKEAEKEAEQIVLDAEAKSLEIIENAKVGVKTFEEKTIKASIEKGNAALDIVKQDEEEKLKRTLVDIEAEVAQLKKTVLAKEADAIAAVKSALVI